MNPLFHFSRLALVILAWHQLDAGAATTEGTGGGGSTGGVYSVFDDITSGSGIGIWFNNLGLPTGCGSYTPASDITRMCVDTSNAFSYYFDCSAFLSTYKTSLETIVTNAANAEMSASQPCFADLTGWTGVYTPGIEGAVANPTGCVSGPGGLTVSKSDLVIVMQGMNIPEISLSLPPSWSSTKKQAAMAQAKKSFADFKSHISSYAMDQAINDRAAHVKLLGGHDTGCEIWYGKKTGSYTKTLDALSLVSVKNNVDGTCTEFNGALFPNTNLYSCASDQQVSSKNYQIQFDLQLRITIPYDSALNVINTSTSYPKANGAGLIVFTTY